MPINNEDFGYLVGEGVPCDQYGLFETGLSRFAILPMLPHFCVQALVCYFDRLRQSAVSAHIQSNIPGQ